VETVKGYAAHEREVFERVTEARAALQQAGTVKEATDANNMVTQALGRLFAVAENYPQLRASENFMELQKQLTDTEEKIAYARQFYNRNVADFNTKILVFPNVFIARMMNLQPFDFFGTEEEAREDVKVSFSTSPPA
jgi:LemA protein